MEIAVSKQYDFVLDLDKGYQSETLTIIQASNNVRKFKVRLTKEGLPFDLTNCIVKAVYSKPDDTVVLNNVEITDVGDGCITVGLTEQCLSEEGRVRCEVVVIDLLNESFITFPVFSFKAKGSLFVGSGVESSTDFQALIQAIAKVESFDDIADEIVGNIQESLEQAQTILVDIKQALSETKDNAQVASDSLDDIMKHLTLAEECARQLESLRSATQLKIRELEMEMQQTQQLMSLSGKKVEEVLAHVEVSRSQVAIHETEVSKIRQNIQKDYEEHKVLQDKISGSLEKTQLEAGQLLTQIKADASNSESLLKKISERAGNSNTWAASINDVLNNAKNRYNEIIKVKAEALNEVSDINYLGVLAELEIEKIQNIIAQGEQQLMNMQKAFDTKMEEFENRFNELVGGNNA